MSDNNLIGHAPTEGSTSEGLRVVANNKQGGFYWGSGNKSRKLARVGKPKT